MAHNAACSDAGNTEQARSGLPDCGMRDTAMAEAVVDLENCFRTIYHTRMRALPIVNASITVRAVDFRPWRDYWFGVLITPWFINLVLLPRVKQTEAVAVGSSCQLSFPCGELVFLGAFEGELGDYLSCSLLSPLMEIENQLQAESIAHEAVRAIFEQHQDDQAVKSVPADKPLPLVPVNLSGDGRIAGGRAQPTAQPERGNGNDPGNPWNGAVTRRGFIKHMAGGFTRDQRRDKVNR